MNQIKRQWESSQSFNLAIKKLRHTLSSEPITCIEDLPNEIYYEIFDYLDGYDAYKAFSQLNIRFHKLLTYSSLSLKINFSYKSQSSVEQCCRQVIIPDKHRILSLHFDSPSPIEKFFHCCNIDSSFNRLESVVLNGVSGYQLLITLLYLNSLPRLFSLTIVLGEDTNSNLSDIYGIVFRLPSLRFNKISILDYDETNFLMPFAINDKFSTIEHLVIGFSCSINEITSILYHTPHLRYLTCKRLVDAEKMDGREVLLTLPNLLRASFSHCYVPFDAFEVFIKKISSHLQVLRLETSNDDAYLNALRWKQLIRKHMTHLRKFHFDHYVDTDDFDVSPNHESISQFTSTFWIDRKWFFEFKHNSYQVVYSIHPYGNNPFYSEEYKQTTVRYTSEPAGHILHPEETDKAHTPSTRLTIESDSSDTWSSAHIDKLKACFLAAKFTHLQIQCDGISIDILIEIIRLLPHLHTLEISSLPTTQLSCLSSEDVEMLLFVSITNTIRKVKLNKIDAIEQVYFLMNLCPRMQSFDVQCTATTDLENLIGSISMNNNTRVPHLCCLSLDIPKANDTIIERLNAITDFERLFHMERAFLDYAIRRIGNKFFFNWKL